MPEYLSLPECSRRYTISEKTLHNWISGGLLQADKVRVNGRMQYLIDPAKLEKVMTDRNMLAFPVRTSTFHDSAGILARLEALEQEVHALKDRLQALEKPHTPDYAPATFSTIPKPRTPALLPPGYVLAYQFLHGVNRTTAFRWIKASPYLEYLGSGHGAQIMLSPEGQRAYYRYAKERVDDFQRCERCPHDD